MYNKNNLETLLSDFNKIKYDIKKIVILANDILSKNEFSNSYYPDLTEDENNIVGMDFKINDSEELEIILIEKSPKYDELFDYKFEIPLDIFLAYENKLPEDEIENIIIQKYFEKETTIDRKITRMVSNPDY